MTIAAPTHSPAPVLSGSSLPVEAPAPQPGTPRTRWSERLTSAVVVVAPLGALVWAAQSFWHHGIGWFDLGLAAALYVVTGFGISLGYHRLFTHRSFHARRWLRITLAVAGSLAAEGSITGWVSHHRRHHVYTDRAGDPHSPWTSERGAFRQLRGLVHAHVGWLFSASPPDAGRWGRDMLADPDVATISKLTPLWSSLTFVLPFAIGWAVTRSITGALLALLWAGGARVALLHHVTWSVNSLGHFFGKRPYPTSDHSGNIAVLSLLSFGESWHNSHHAAPNLARAGRGSGQLDPTARLLWVFERLGWVSNVRWATPDRRGLRLAG